MRKHLNFQSGRVMSDSWNKAHQDPLLIPRRTANFNSDIRYGKISDRRIPIRVSIMRTIMRMEDTSLTSKMVTCNGRFCF